MRNINKYNKAIKPQALANIRKHQFRCQVTEPITTQNIKTQCADHSVMRTDTVSCNHSKNRVIITYFVFHFDISLFIF